MLAPPSLFAGRHETNLAVGSAALRLGTLITANATPHNKATSFTTLIAATTRASYGIFVRILGVHVSATVTNMLVDIALGAAGSEKVIIPNLNASGAVTPTTSGSGGKMWHFPGIYVPAGARVSARCQATIASDTCSVAVYLAQDAEYDFMAGPVVDYGTNLAASTGASVTEGTNAFGAWGQIVASTSKAHKLWTVGTDMLADTTITQGDNLIELGVGANPNEKTFYRSALHEGGNEYWYAPFPHVQYCPLPAGVRISARIAAAGAEARGVIVHGF